MARGFEAKKIEPPPEAVEEEKKTRPELKIIENRKISQEELTKARGALKVVGGKERPEEVEAVTEEVEKEMPEEKKELRPALEEEKKTIEKEIKEMSEQKRFQLGRGLSNLGYVSQELKSKFFRWALKKAGSLTKEKGTMDRFLGSYAEQYTKQVEQAKRAREKSYSGKLERGAGILKLGGNLLKYGRVLWDLNYANPLRHVMAASMLIGRTAEAAKEARFKNEKVVEKTRIKDIDVAAEEAWKIHQEAKKKTEQGEKISKEDLDKSYRGFLPEDLKKRLQKNPDGVASNIVRKVIQKDIEWSVKRIDKKLTKIEQDKKLSAGEKESRKEQLLQRQGKFLKELDGMVANAGTVDLIAYGCKMTETAGKATSIAMMIDTIGRLPQMLSSITRIAGAGEIVEGEKVIEAPKPTGMTKEEYMAKVDAEKPAGMTKEEYMAKVGAGTEEPKLKTRGIKPLEESLKEAEELEPKVKAEAEERRIRDAKTKPLEESLKEAKELEGKAAEISPEAAKAEPFEIAEKVDIKRGDSIWSVAEKYLKGNTAYQGLIEINDKDVVEALETYNIDRVKDAIVANPQAYGLPAGVNLDKLTIGQLKGIDWEKAFADAFPEGKGLTDGLTQEQVDSIVENNKTLKTFFKEHPKAPRTSENYESVLKGKGITGEVAEAEKVVPPEPAEKVEKMAPVITEAHTIKAKLSLIEDYKMTPSEAEAISGEKVGNLLKIPKNWTEAAQGDYVKIKHDGVFGYREYKKYWQLASDIRASEPGPEEMEMTIKEYLAKVEANIEAEDAAGKAKEAVKKEAVHVEL